MILNLYGTLNSSFGSILTYSCFSFGLAIGRNWCNFTNSWVLYFLYLTRQPSSTIFSSRQGQNSPSPEQMALQCIPSLNKSESGSFRTLRKQAGSSMICPVPYLLTFAVCSSTSTSWTTEFFHFLSSSRKHFTSFPISLPVSSSTLKGQALIFFSFSLKEEISSFKASSIFSCIISSSFFSSSSVSSREIKRLILASDFLSSMMEAQCSMMLWTPPSSCSRVSYLLPMGSISLALLSYI